MRASRPAGRTAAATPLGAAGRDGRSALTDAETGELADSLGVVLRSGSQSPAPAAELSVGLYNTREFGLVVAAGTGGLEATLPASCFGRDGARVFAAVALTDAADFLALFRRTVAYRKLAAGAARAGRPQPDRDLEGLFARMLDLATALATAPADDPFVLETLVLDPLDVTEQMTARGITCRLKPRITIRPPRPVQKIDKLLHPRSIGIVGVSASGMNFGRIILRNLIGGGYPRAQLTVIRPGESEIEGVRCVGDVAALERKLDLLIVAVAADTVPRLVDEIVASDAANSVMLIPGGLGETERSRVLATALAARIDAAHRGPGGGPVFLGANCLGVVSHPGAYDSWFIPLERLPKPRKKPVRNSALISQSGAFMITRLSTNPWLDPAYMIAVGNQSDLTHGDLLGYFADRRDIETVGVYLEGFVDGDGLDFVRAVRRAAQNGQQVVVYKAGATVTGAAAVLGHTASVAGDPTMFDSVVRHAGAIVATDFAAFDDLLYVAGALHHKKIGDRRLGAISGAGFEAVGMADAAGEGLMQLGGLDAATMQRIGKILAAHRLDALVEVRNPIDINPAADDVAHLEIVEAFLDDPNIDVVAVGLDPTAPSVRALEKSTLRPGYDMADPKSTVQLLPSLVERHDKPVVGVVDGGHLYDAMAAALMDRGVCVFRNCGRAAAAVARYVDARLWRESLRRARPGEPQIRPKQAG